MGTRTPVAYFPDTHMRREELGQRVKVERADILEINPSGDPAAQGSTYSQRQIARKRTVKLKVTQALHAANNGAIVWVEPRFILSTWEEYTTARAAYLEYAERSRNSTAEKAAKRAADAAELERLLASVGFKTDGAYGDADRVNVRETDRHTADATATVTFTLAQFQALLERVSS
jgi:hypothetical protein